MLQNKAFLLVAMGLMSIVGAGLCFVVVACWSFYTPLLPKLEQATSVKVYPGDTLHSFARHLYTKHWLRSPLLFKVGAYINGRARPLRFGEYVIHPGMSAATALDHMISGQGLLKRHIVLLEGWTLHDMQRALASNDYLSHGLDHQTDAEVASAIGFPGQQAEGWFMPDTYTFTWGDTAGDILKQAYHRMRDYLQLQWNNRAAGLLYTSPYQALIVASLVEKETASDEDRPIVAAVILNRLAAGMHLQVDPTVQYGLNLPQERPLTKSDLRYDTPYNTYRNLGLPPTPIANPSQASIRAALHPKPVPYFYYLSGGHGRLIFSVTYQQHRQAIARLFYKHAASYSRQKEGSVSARLSEWRMCPIYRRVD